MFFFFRDSKPNSCFNYSGFILDIENRPVEGATITDESSYSVSTSFRNGSYSLPIGDGRLINYLILKTQL